MAELSEELVSLVEAVASPLVEHPDELEVVSSVDEEDGAIIIEMRVNPDDAGKVIGRQGRVIKSIRTLARAAGSVEGVPVEVELID